MKKIITSFVIIFLLWIAIAGVSAPELLLGIAVALVFALLISRNTHIKSFSSRTIGSILKFTLLYIPLFIFKLLQSNLQLAKTLLSPSLHINPGIVRVKTNISNDVGKFVLANSITLTPGTITLDVEDDVLYVHCVDVKGKDEIEHFENVSKDFEKVLGGVFR